MGRPRKYGEEIKLNELFVTAKDKFKKAEVMLYGKKSKVSYYSVDLIWRPIKSKIRFVLVEYQGNKIILMSSNLEFAPLTIIQLYGHRFKIEVTIKGLKHCIGAFNYHFWSKAMPQFSKKKSVNLGSAESTKTSNYTAVLSKIWYNGCKSFRNKP